MSDNCPECYMKDGAHKMDCSVWRRNLKEEIEEGLDHTSLITVSNLQEHEDGSATMDIETSPEATRLLVEVGLTALLEKAIDEENKEYGLHE